jgi:hypothetical protein
MPCVCAGCREWARENGRTPEEDWAAQLVEPVYGVEGFDQFGFDPDGRDPDGYDRNGRDPAGLDREGYDRRGYNVNGFNREGYDRDGYDREGLHYSGFDRDGFSRVGLNEYGFDRDGFNEYGMDVDGFNREGFDRYGFDRDGFNSDGFDQFGWDRNGFNREGEQRPCDCYDCQLERNEAPEIVTILPESVGLPDLDCEDDCGTYDEYHRDSIFSSFDNYRESWLNSYSYTPNLIFRRQHGEDKAKVPFYGMEIEMTSCLTTLERDIGHTIGLDDRLLYFKADGSVDGFEMVTHPMTSRWAEANFPWEIVELMAGAGASVQPSCNGLHIHVSRSGFSDEAHLYRWLKLWYRNENDIIHVAGRNGGEWGGFHEEQRKLHMTHAKARAKERHNPRQGQMLRGRFNGERYSAVNLQNPNTVEVRLFAATTSAKILRTRFELVSSSVEYTRNMSSKKVMKGGWNWDSYMLWLDEHGDTYDALAEYQENSILGAISRQRHNQEPALTLA